MNILADVVSQEDRDSVVWLQRNLGVLRGYKAVQQIFSLLSPQV